VSLLKQLQIPTYTLKKINDLGRIPRRAVRVLRRPGSPGELTQNPTGSRMAGRISHAVGFDDAPFDRSWRGDVLVVGAVYAGLRLEGVVSGKVRRDGVNATHKLIEIVGNSRFRHHLQAILLQGIALAGFNVVDIHRLHEVTGLPVIVVARRPPDLAAIRRALLHEVPGGRRKLRLIERAGPMEATGRVYIQRAGIARERAAEAIRRFSADSALPEPLRTAHLIAGGVAAGESRHRP
jgi:endonuclease V-like protein UPF0215 family